MSRSRFIQYKDFTDLEELSIFVSNLKTGSLINIETGSSISINTEINNSDQTFRVWYYNT